MAKEKPKSEAPDDAGGSDQQATAGSQNSGCLELTWSNQDRALLSREDGTYEWVPKRDYRVAEARLLREAGTVGDVHPEDERSQDNLLIRGDSLNALTALVKVPEFADQYVGKVKLAYLDPPFNTGQAFEQYDDGLEHSVWLTMMRDRLMLIRDLLSPEGSIWVHLDDIEMAYCKVLMDAVFGRGNFIGTVIWGKSDSPKSSARHFSTDQDYLLVYATSAEVWRPVRLPRSEAVDAKYQNPDNDPRGRWFADNLTGSKPYSKGAYAVQTPAGTTIEGPGKGRWWTVSEERLRELDADGRIWWGPKGVSKPTIKRYLSEVGDLVPRTFWDHREVGSNRTAKNEIKKLFPGVTPFETPKPERLMERIVHIASNPGDIVLDCFAGSGTTASVAHKMGRWWVTAELEQDTIDQFTAPRLEKVVKGEDSGGISQSCGWEGGGGFRVLDVAPSMYQDDGGVVVLADWASESKLAEAVAAQLGFEYEVDPPFCGRHGKVRLAVIDGHADETVVRLLVKSLDKGDKLSLCATSLDPEASTLLAKLERGSQARVVPQDLLLTYRTPSAWRVSVAR